MSGMIWAVTKPGRVTLVGTRIHISHLFIPHAPQPLYVISDNGTVISAQSLGLEAAKLFAEAHHMLTGGAAREMAS